MGHGTSPQLRTCHIPETGCIISPDVEIFRGGTDLGYPFLPKVVRLPIISVAMPNRNPQVRDAPVDAPRDLRIYRELVFQKFGTMLHAASELLSGRPGIRGQKNITNHGSPWKEVMDSVVRKKSWHFSYYLGVNYENSKTTNGTIGSPSFV